MRLNDDVSYADLRRILGPPGSVVAEDDPAVRRVDVFAWIRGMVPVELPRGEIVAVCLSGETLDDPSPRAWLSEPASIG
jgi:hypothetical protein